MFSQKSLEFFCDPCFYVTFQKFILLDYVALLHVTVPVITLKRLVCIYFQ